MAILIWSLYRNLSNYTTWLEQYPSRVYFQNNGGKRSTLTFIQSMHSQYLFISAPMPLTQGLKYLQTYVNTVPQYPPQRQIIIFYLSSLILHFGLGSVSSHIVSLFWGLNNCLYISWIDFLVHWSGQHSRSVTGCTLQPLYCGTEHLKVKTMLFLYHALLSVTRL